MNSMVFLHDHLAYRGGGEMMLGRVARIAQPLGEVRLGLLWGEDLDGLTVEERAVFCEIRSFRFPNRVSLSGIWPHIQARRELEAWLRTRSPNTVASFNLRAAVRAAALVKAMRFRHVWMCQQSFPLFEPPARLFKELLGLRILLASKTEIVCIAEEAVSGFERLGFPRKRLYLIRNGVDVDRFQNLERAELPIPESESTKLIGADLIAVCVARIDPIKQHDVLLHAVALAREKGTQVTVLAVGSPGPLDREYAKNLQQLADSLKITDCLVWAGQRDDVRPWLAAADVAVLSSRKEAAGLVLAEAAAAGLPLLGSNVGGIPELVRDGITGFIFQPDRPNQLAEHFVHLANDVQLRKTMGQNARSVVLEEFNAQKQDRRWMEILKREPANTHDRE